MRYLAAIPVIFLLTLVDLFAIGFFVFPALIMAESGAFPSSYKFAMKAWQQ